MEQRKIRQNMIKKILVFFSSGTQFPFKKDSFVYDFFSKTFSANNDTAWLML